MISRDAQLRFVSVLRERVAEDYGMDDSQPDALAGFIAESCEIETLSARNLLWAEDADLDAEAIDRLASCFAFHRELLAVVLLPSSSEMVAETLIRVRSHDLNVNECLTCMDIAEAIDRIRDFDDEEMLALAVEVLAHVVVRSQGEELSQAAAEEDHEESHQHHDVREDQLIDQLINVVLELEPEVQQRVLAFAHMERAKLSAEPSTSRFAALSSLRSEHLSQRAREVLDLLSDTDGEYSAQRLVLELGLSDARSLGQLARSVERAMRSLQAAGYQLEQSPLVVRSSRSGRFYALDPECREIWRALTRAERSTAAPGPA